MRDDTSAYFIVFFLAIPVITGLLARRKGYSFVLWLFSGILGLIVLAFLPFANKAEMPPEVQAEKRKTGNIVGVVLTVLAVGFSVMRTMFRTL